MSLDSRLLNAVVRGDLVRVRLLLAVGASVDAVRGSGASALALALVGGRVGVVRELLGAGASVGVARGFLRAEFGRLLGDGPAVAAVDFVVGLLRVADAVVADGGVELLDEDWMRSVLMSLPRPNGMPLVELERLLGAACGRDGVRRRTTGLVRFAAMHLDVRVIEWALRNESVGISDDEFGRIVRLMFEHNRLVGLPVMLEHVGGRAGVFPSDAVSRLFALRSWGPYVSSGDLELLWPLLERGFSVNEPIVSRLNPLDFLLAACSGDRSPDAALVALRWVVYAGGSLGAVERAVVGDSFVFRGLVRSLGRIPGRDRSDFRVSFVDALRALVDAGWDPKLVGRDGRTALHELASLRIPSANAHLVEWVVDALVDAGVSVGALDADGYSAVQLARARSGPAALAVAKALVRHGAPKRTSRSPSRVTTPAAARVDGSVQGGARLGMECTEEQLFG